MSVEEVLMDAEERMEKANSVLKNALSGIRTGRATPGLVDSVRVEAYGSQSPLKQLASIAAPEPTSGWASQLPNGQFQCISNAGHLTPMEAPEEFGRMLCEFLA